MKKFLNPIPAAKLCEHTDLRAICSNETRWSSTHVMLQRYLEIKQFISKVELSGIERLLLTPVENKRIEKLSELIPVSGRSQM